MNKSKLGAASSAMMTLVGNLRDIGVEGDVALPKIAFVGEQSAGKSTALKSITGIETPRSSGTCTRCFIEITTTKAPVWNCKIGVRCTDRNGATPHHLITLTNESQRPLIVDYIAQGQEMLINPTESEANGWRVTPADLWRQSTKNGELRFTENCVTVAVSGPNEVDIIVMDCPGLISTAQPGHESDIKVIENGVKNQIKDTNTVIVACLCCEHDFEHQKITSLVRGIEDRTVIVLTKPDRIQKGDEYRFVQVFEGSEGQDALFRSSFVIRTEAPSELDLDSASIEKTFFETDSTGKLFQEVDPSRCGCVALQTCLTTRQAEQLSAKIPSIEEDLRAKLKLTNRRLGEMGQTLTSEECVDQFDQMIESFVKLIIDSINDQNHANKVGNLHKKFYNQLSESVPDFEKWSRVSQWKDAEKVAAVVNNKEKVFMPHGFVWGDDKKLVTKKNSAKADAADKPPMRIFRAVTGGSVLVVADGARQTADLYSWNQRKKRVGHLRFQSLHAKKFQRIEKSEDAMYRAEKLIDSVRTHKGNQSISWEVAWYCQKDWAKMSHDLVAEVGKLTGALVNEQSESVFQDFERLKDRVLEVTHKQLASQITKSKAFLKELHAMGQESMTFNATLQSDLKDQFSKRLWADYGSFQNFDGLTKRDKKRVTKSLGMVGNTLDSLASNNNELLTKIIPIASEALAYFEIAQMRFGDNVPLICNMYVQRDFYNTIRRAVVVDLGLNYGETSGLVKLMLEFDPAKEKIRKNLFRDKTRLQSGLKLLTDFADNL